MYNDMVWDIRFKQDGKEFRLNMLDSCEVVSSVNNLADTAMVKIPESNLNRLIVVEDRIKRGAEVSIALGYNGNLKDEFAGYITSVTHEDSTIQINCEDALFLFRKKVPNKQLKSVTLKDIAQYLIDSIDPSFSVKSTYDINYQKFVIKDQEASDVLLKIQTETKANIYFDSIEKVLHIHAPYEQSGDPVKYSVHKNVESSSLQYKEASERKLEIIVECKDISGKTHKVEKGEKGEEKLMIKAGVMAEADATTIAEAVLKRNNANRYEGSFTAWLVPFVKPTYKANMINDDYPNRNGDYYVAAVKTNFSDQGATREVELSIQI